MTKSIYSTRLRDRTLYLVQERPARIKLTRIARDTGLPLSWLSAFTRGEIDEPSVCRIECLYEYLTGKQLEI